MYCDFSGEGVETDRNLDQWPDPLSNPVRKKILVVEDDSDIQCLLRFFVQSAGHDVEIVSSGEVVVERIREQSAPHLILLDRMLPGRSGAEILSCIRHSDRWRHVPVLIVSALADKRDIETLLSRGAAGYLTKPFIPSVMVRSINNILSL